MSSGVLCSLIAAHCLHVEGSHVQGSRVQGSRVRAWRGELGLRCGWPSAHGGSGQVWREAVCVQQGRWAS